MHFSQVLLGKIEAFAHQRTVRRALELHRRGEVRPDGLEASKMCTRLDIQWRARDVHPWDRDLSQARRARLFLDQSVADTEAAVRRLFAGLPHVDRIDVSVLGPGDAVLITGTVQRSSLAESEGFISPRMRLQELGLTCHIFDSESILSIHRKAS
ncbi:MAG TPA: hypothetical protein VLV86_25290 [Vicinamibacterales bacterium]|nr:hypothetical protein [Vicinamibacterales bacterium]